jgi:hypothetical protein
MLCVVGDWYCRSKERGGFSRRDYARDLVDNERRAENGQADGDCSRRGTAEEEQRKHRPNRKPKRHHIHKHKRKYTLKDGRNHTGGVLVVVDSVCLYPAPIIPLGSRLNSPIASKM